METKSNLPALCVGVYFTDVNRHKEPGGFLLINQNSPDRMVSSLMR